MQSSQESDKITLLRSEIEQILSSSLEKTSSSFSPFLAKTLEGSDFICASYCPSHNMIIAFPYDYTMRFYDAATLFPLEGRKIQKLDGIVMSMAYDDEIETLLLGCSSGLIYAYNAGSDELKMLRRCENETVMAIEFLSSSFYAFGRRDQKQLSIGNLKNEEVINIDLNDKKCTSLHNLYKKGLLLSGFSDGSVRIYRTNKLPYLQMIFSVQAHQAGQQVTAIQNIKRNGKEFLVTAGSDCTVKILHLRKGRVKLLRVIHLRDVVDSVVYLENHQILAIIAGDFGEIEFWRVISGKLERKLDFRKGTYLTNLFLMKDKNMVACLETRVGILSCDFIQLIQLPHCEGK